MYKVSLAAARVNVGMSQKEVAKTLGVSNTTVVSWEKGHTSPNADMFAQLCKLYGVPYDMLKILSHS